MNRQTPAANSDVPSFFCSKRVKMAEIISKADRIQHGIARGTRKAIAWTGVRWAVLPWYVGVDTNNTTPDYADSDLLPTELAFEDTLRQLLILALSLLGRPCHISCHIDCTVKV